ncbi:MAG: hypothetical protein IT379_43055 [Deltaproteobacteria bacterium]|nr:hypothetical protein [Deltaproteobacteria bacterium]
MAGDDVSRDLCTELGWLARTVGVAAVDDEILLAITGDDARSWIHGMVTNDLRPLDARDGAIETAVVGVKGKLLAVAWVYARGEARWMAVPRETADALREFFDRYIVMEDVTVAACEELRITSVRGPMASDVVAAAGLSDAAFANDRSGVSGTDVFLDAASYETSMARLVEAARSAGGGRVSDEALEIARVRAGRGRWGRDIDGTLYPQEAGLVPRAVSFQKGCYVGQEVVCTLEMRGHVKRISTRVRFEGTEAPARGDEIWRDGVDDDPIGRVTSVVSSPTDDALLALGILKRNAVEAGVRVHTTSGVRGEVLGPAS